MELSSSNIKKNRIFLEIEPIPPQKNKKKINSKNIYYIPENGTF